MTIYEAYKIGKKYINNSSDLISIFKSVFGLDRVGISINANLEVSNEKLKLKRKQSFKREIIKESTLLKK